MDVMGLKSKILEELLEDLDHNQGMGLKPKAAVSITAVKPESGMDLDDKGGDPLEGMMGHSGGGSEDGELSDEDLQEILASLGK